MRCVKDHCIYYNNEKCRCSLSDGLNMDILIGLFLDGDIPIKCYKLDMSIFLR